MNDIIVWQEHDRIGHLVLNDPPSNRMTKAFFDRLYHLTTDVIPKSDIDAVIIYGEGRHFSSGADLDDLLNNIYIDAKVDENGNITEYPSSLVNNNKSFVFFRNLKIPVVAAIRGVCIGSALELALACNLRICSDNSVFGFPESTYNIMPGCCGTQNILNCMNYSKAVELILTGSNFNAEQALKYNIVNKIVNKKEIVIEAVKIAKACRDKFRIFNNAFQKKCDGQQGLI